jgi:hypothetical protein
MQDFQQKTQTYDQSAEDDLRPMVNKALQQEILFYATLGIQECAKHASESTGKRVSIPHIARSWLQTMKSCAGVLNAKER